MKKFQKYLDKSEEMIKFSEFVTKNCKPWFNKVKDLKLYRGMRDPRETFIKEKVRKDRISRVMFKEKSKKMDDAFYKNFKIRGRTQCLYGTGDITHAYIFGTVYIIFPIGNFDFLWSPKIEDLNYKDSKTKYYNFTEQSEYDDWIKKNYVKNKDLNKAIKFGHEIMISCDSYCGIRYHLYNEM